RANVVAIVDSAAVPGGITGEGCPADGHGAIIDDAAATAFQVPDRLRPSPGARIPAPPGLVARHRAVGDGCGHRVRGVVEAREAIAAVDAARAEGPVVRDRAGADGQGAGVVDAAADPCGVARH